MKNTINVTKAFIKTNVIKEYDIQLIRLLMYLLKKNAEKYFSGEEYFTIKRYQLYKEVFTYQNNGKEKKLMDYSYFCKWMDTRNKDFVTFNHETGVYYFNLRYSKIFTINGTKKDTWDKERKKEIDLQKKGKIDMLKVRPEYTEMAYKKIKYDEWDVVSLSNQVTVKIFFYILSECMRGPFRIIQTNLNEIATDMNIGIGNRNRAKIKIFEALTLFKTIEFIRDFEVNGYNIKIEKRNRL